MGLTELIACIVMMGAGFLLLQQPQLAYRKIGMMLIWLTSGLTAYLFSRSVTLAIFVLLAWLLFPLWEMLFVLRKLRVPRQRELTDARAPRDSWEELSSLTHALSDAGFEQLDECRLQPAQHEQYYRIFSRKDGLIQATIGYVAQGAIGFHFLAFTSQSRDGRRWVTWDYPLTYGLVMPPNTAVYRALQCENVPDLLQAHQDFLEINEIPTGELLSGEQTAVAARARLEQTLNQQIDYNVSRGYLAPAADTATESFCYSWRGTLYVAGQVLRDLLF